MSKKYRFAINVENGQVLYRSEVTDKYPILFRLVDDETAKAISGGKVDGKQIAAAVLRKDMSAPGFDPSEYDRVRKATKIARCMSEREMIPVTEAVEGVPETDNEAAVLKLSDIIGEEKKPEKAKSPSKAQAVAKDDAGAY